MISPFPVAALAKDLPQCEKDLSRLLQSESLALIIGAGASAGMGLPSWFTLVQICCESVGLQDDFDKLVAEFKDNIPNDKLTRLTDRFETECGSKEVFHAKIKEALYKNVEDDDSLFGQPLLSVLGALLMKSSRGSISEVVTLNFDDILERYLNLHGFSSQVLSTLPSLHVKSDVKIYHMHGFLPSTGSESVDSDEVVFTKYSFEKMLGAKVDLWKEQLRNVLERKVAIFVGLSFNSPTLQSVLTSIGECNRERGPSGFWYVGPNDAPETESDLIKRNIVPIRVNDHKETQRSLLRVCQLAMQGV